MIFFLDKPLVIGNKYNFLDKIIWVTASVQFRKFFFVFFTYQFKTYLEIRFEVIVSNVWELIIIRI